MNKTLDGIKKVPVKPGNKHRIQTKKHFNAKKFVSIFAAVAITFVATFLLAVTASRIMAGSSTPQGSGMVLGASTDSLGSPLVVSSDPEQDMTFNNIVITEPATVFLPDENISATDPLINREDFLKQYLTVKGSPLADHVSAISGQSQWKLIVAIAQAESSSCKKYPEHTSNCWGVGGASNLMQFPNLDAAIAHVNQLLETKYVSQGLDSPGKLVKKWVGHSNNQWEQAVQQVLNSLQNVQ